MRTLSLISGIVLEGVADLVFITGYFSGSPVLIVAGVALICVAFALIFKGILVLFSPVPGVRGASRATPGPGVIYEDRLVSITGDGITFFHYYFPILSSRRVDFADIDYITVNRATLRTGSWRIWGSGNLRTWFPLDASRPSRDLIFCAIVRGRGMNVGFTVEDSARVQEILSGKGLLRPDPGS
jgi:hypothetical protein